VPPKRVEIISDKSDGSRTDIIDVVEGAVTTLRCLAADSKPKTNLEWIATG